MNADQPATTYDQMMIEHLGPEATAADLAAFRDACERVLPAFDDVYAATDYIWGDGDYSRRLDAGVCIYCDRLLADEATLVPNVDDNAGWERLASQHEMDCEWIATRAHRQSRGKAGV